MMKSQLNEYYQCSPQGYVKQENIKTDHLPTNNEIPVSSRCNQVLPYKLHPIEIGQPVPVNAIKQSLSVVFEQPKKNPVPEVKKQHSFSPLNYSFSASLMQNPIRNLEKDEVSSIHLDDKTSARTKIDEREKDLTTSTFTYLKKPKYDMKRSLFQTNRSIITTDTNPKDSEKLDMIIHELAKERGKRQEFQKKYQVLFTMVNQSKNQSATVSGLQQTPFSSSLPSPKYSPALNRKKNYQIKSETQSSSEQQDEEQVIVDYRKGRRKCSSPSPIIINLGSDLLYKNSSTSLSKFTPSQEEISELTEIKGSLQMIQTQMATIHENLEYLEKKTEGQQQRRQKEILLQELKEKERKIEEIIKENQKIKEINELLLTQKSHPEKNSYVFNGLNLEKNTIAVGFIISLLVAVLVLILRSSIC